MFPSRDWDNELPSMLARREPESLYLDYKERRALVPLTKGGSVDRQKRAIVRTIIVFSLDIRVHRFYRPLYAGRMSLSSGKYNGFRFADQSPPLSVTSPPLLGPCGM